MRRVLLACAAALALACAVEPGKQGNWQARKGLDDPRIGRIWDTAARDWVERDDFLSRARTYDFVLLGEKHDNPDHHHLQGVVIQSLAREGVPATLAVEMLSDDDRPKLAAWYASYTEDVEALGEMLDWKHSGWPPWPIYRPVFMAAIARSLRIEPANLSRAQLAELRRSGLAGMPAEERQRLAIDPPLSPDAAESLADEIRAGHCGTANDAMVATMTDLQRARDAALADALVRSGVPAVLIAGAGHVRKDRGVPLYLARRAPQRHVLALAFVEVGERGAETQGQLERAFDYLWWTPRVDDLDPCERFKEQLEKMGKHREGAS